MHLIHQDKFLVSKKILLSNKSVYVSVSVSETEFWNEWVLGTDVVDE